MKKTLYLSFVLGLSIFLMAGQVFAVEISMNGKLSSLDLDSDNNGYFETLRFLANDNLDYSGDIQAFFPEDDGLFSDDPLEYFKMPDLVLSGITDEYTVSIGGKIETIIDHHLTGTFFSDGFQVYDDNDELLFEGDLTIDKITSFGSIHFTNAQFQVNITDVTSGLSYKDGTSAIVDAFLASKAGMFQFDFQTGKISLGSELPTDQTYSAKAAPTPEPATIILLGTGLIGLAILGKKRKQK